jgi:hypothetical protein
LYALMRVKKAAKEWRMSRSFILLVGGLSNEKKMLFCAFWLAQRYVQTGRDEFQYEDCGRYVIWIRAAPSLYINTQLPTWAKQLV